MEFKTKEELEIGFWVRAGFAVALGLSLAEKEVYALIRSFSAAGDGEYYGNQYFIAEVLGVSLPTVGRAINSLLAKGLLRKEGRAGRYKESFIYRANVELEEELTEAYLRRARGRLKVESTYRSDSFRAKSRLGGAGKDSAGEAIARELGALPTGSSPKVVGAASGSADDTAAATENTLRELPNLRGGWDNAEAATAVGATSAASAVDMEKESAPESRGAAITEPAGEDLNMESLLERAARRELEVGAALSGIRTTPTTGEGAESAAVASAECETGKGDTRITALERWGLGEEELDYRHKAKKESPQSGDGDLNASLREWAYGREKRVEKSRLPVTDKREELLRVARGRGDDPTYSVDSLFNLAVTRTYREE